MVDYITNVACARGQQGEEPIPSQPLEPERSRRYAGSMAARGGAVSAIGLESQSGRVHGADLCVGAGSRRGASGDVCGISVMASTLAMAEAAGHGGDRPGCAAGSASCRGGPNRGATMKQTSSQAGAMQRAQGVWSGSARRGRGGPTSRSTPIVPARTRTQILSPAAIVGLHHAETLLDGCSRRYADVDETDDGASLQPSRCADAHAPFALKCCGCGPAGASLVEGGRLRDGTGAAVQLRSSRSSFGDCDDSSGGAQSSSSTDRHTLLAQLQRSFQRLDKTGSGMCSTVPLLRALRGLLASQAASQGSSRGWARGLRHVCTDMEERIGVACRQEDRGVQARLWRTIAWEHVLEMANEVPGPTQQCCKPVGQL